MKGTTHFADVWDEARLLAWSTIGVGVVAAGYVLAVLVVI